MEKYIQALLNKATDLPAGTLFNLILMLMEVQKEMMDDVGSKAGSVP